MSTPATIRVAGASGRRRRSVVPLRHAVPDKGPKARPPRGALHRRSSILGWTDGPLHEDPGRMQRGIHPMSGES